MDDALSTYSDHMKQIINSLEEVKEKLCQADMECRYLEKSLAQYPVNESRNRLSSILGGRGVDFSSFINSTFIEMGKSVPLNCNDLHGSQLINARRAFLKIKIDEVEKQLLELKGKQKNAENLSQDTFTNEEGLKFVDIREDYHEDEKVPRYQEEITEPSSHVLNIKELATSKSSCLDDEIDALLRQAELDEEELVTGKIPADKRKDESIDGVDTNDFVITEQDDLKPKKKVQFAPTVKVKSLDIEEVVEEEEEILNDDSSSVDDIEIHLVDEFEDTSETSEDTDDYDHVEHVMGVPRHIMERYLDIQNGQASALSPSPKIAANYLNHHSLKVLGTIQENVHEDDVDVSSGIDDFEEDSEMEIDAKEMAMAYYKHRKRLQARLENMKFESDIDPETFDAEQKKHEQEMVRDAVSKLSISNNFSMKATSSNVDEKENKNSREKPKISRFKAQRLQTGTQKHF